MGHFFGWGVLLQIAAIVHWARRRPATYWLFIIIFFGFLGALAYFLVEGIDFGSIGHSIKGPSRRRRIRHLQALIRDNPSAGNYEELGDLLLTEGRFAEAKTAFDAALSQRTDSVDPFYRRGIAEYELGQYTGAIADFERVVKQEPKYDYSRARCLLAQSLAKAGRTADAEAAFDALVSSTTSCEATIGAAEFYANRGRTNEARELAESMLARRATMPAYQVRRDRPFLRRATKLLRRIPAT
ncbi:MAG TPA: tetratricopeptide repeat protein [Thermoanaerobaculia bacterium]|nr:tetratricopeptide repeat protein [Thermoanaerobaculia bacterium]